MAPSTQTSLPIPYSLRVSLRSRLAIWVGDGSGDRLNPESRRQALHAVFLVLQACSLSPPPFSPAPA